METPSPAETRRLIAAIRADREQLKCPRTNKRAVAINTGKDFQQQPLMCAKCLINYSDPFVDRDLEVYPIEEFLEGIEAALDNSDACPGASALKLNEKNLKSIATVFQWVCNNVHEQVEHQIQKSVQQYKDTLMKTLEGHFSKMDCQNKTLEAQTDVEAGDRIKAIIWQGYNTLKDSPLQDTHAKLAEISEKMDDEASALAFSQEQTSSLSVSVEPVLAAVTNRIMRGVNRRLQIPPIESLANDVAYRHAFPEVRTTSAETTDFCWWISPVKMSSFYGFTMGVLSSRSTPMNVKVYEGEDKNSKVLADFEFVLPCEEKKVVAYPGQTEKTHLVLLPSPVPLVRSKWYLLSVQPLASLHNQTIQANRNEAFAGSYVATNIGRNDKEIKVYYKMQQGMDRSGADLYNSTMAEIFLVQY